MSGTFDTGIFDTGIFDHRVESRLGGGGGGGAGRGGAPIWSEVSWFKKKKRKKEELVEEIAEVVEQALPQVSDEQARIVAQRLMEQMTLEQLRRIETLNAFMARVEAEIVEMDDEEVLLLAA